MSSPTRRIAVVAWVGLLVTPVLFCGVTLVNRGPADPAAAQFSGIFLWMSAAMGGLGVALSRAIPGRIRARPGASRDAVALTRLLVAWGILEGGAMFPLLAQLVTGDPWLYVIAAVPLAAFLTLYPTEDRWRRSASEPPPAGGASRME